MKSKFLDKDLFYFIAVIFVLFILIAVPFIDKARCEKNGGKYIWEYTEDSKCHLVGDK